MTRTAPSVGRRSSLACLMIAVPLLFLGASPVAGAPAPLAGSGTGSIVAPAASSPIAVIATARPSDVVFSRDGATAYVADGFTDTISVIDVVTGTELSTIALPAEPSALAISSDGLWLYAADFGAELLKIDTTTLVVTPVAAPSLLTGVAVSPDGARLYGISSTTIEVMSASTGASIASITPGIVGGASIAASPDGARVFAGSIGDNKIVAIDAATNGVITTITTAGVYPTGLAFSPDGSRLYATAQQDNAVSVIDTATAAVTATGIAAGSNPTRIAVSPNGLYAYVADNNADTMTILDLSTNTAISAPATGLNPSGIAVSPDGTRVFVANYDSNDVTAFDVARLAFSGQGEVTPGTDASFALSLTNGDSPIANYTAGTAVVELLDSSSTVVATGGGVSPDAAGIATAVVPTAGLAVGSYTVRITFTDPAGVVVAQAAGFSIATALAATGTESGPVLLVALALVVVGLAITLARAGARASGRRISRRGRRG